MSKPTKFSLINVSNDFQFSFQEGDKIVYEMPSFCSGDYEAIVKKDPDFGLYIDSSENHFEGCRDFAVIRNGEQI
jgi:hypothetical protein